MRCSTSRTPRRHRLLSSCDSATYRMLFMIGLGFLGRRETDQRVSTPKIGDEMGGRGAAPHLYRRHRDLDTLRSEVFRPRQAGLSDLRACRGSLRVEAPGPDT